MVEAADQKGTKSLVFGSQAKRTLEEDSEVKKEKYTKKDYKMCGSGKKGQSIFLLR